MKNPEPLRPLPAVDPYGGGPLVVTELSTADGSIRIAGRFALPRFARLDEEQTRFLETFLRCRGMLNGVERELGLSYPTVRARLDALLEALELAPAAAPPRRSERSADAKRRILDELERGAITPAEAKDRLRHAHDESPEEGA